jgi:hypothetical protein
MGKTPKTKVVIEDDYGKSLNLQFRRSMTVVPSATVTFEPGLLYVGTGGNIKVWLVDDITWQTFNSVPDGTLFTGLVKAVHTDTTASNMVIVY